YADDVLRACFVLETASSVSAAADSGSSPFAVYRQDMEKGVGITFPILPHLVLDDALFRYHRSLERSFYDVPHSQKTSQILLLNYNPRGQLRAIGLQQFPEEHTRPNNEPSPGQDTT